MLHFFHICNSTAFNVDSNLNTAKHMCQQSNSYFLFRLQVYIWWTLYHTAWFTSQESCCSHTATRVLSLKRKWCHNEPYFLLSVRIFFLEILCVDQPLAVQYMPEGRPNKINMQLFQSVQTNLAAQATLYSIGIWVPSWKKSGQSLKLTSQLHLM
jgi:hypothetical protein